MSSLLTESEIRCVVKDFYARVQQDELLAPIFASKIADTDWPQHVNHITGFWSSIFLKTGQFSGNPMQKHLGIEGLTPAHFTRWLTLFKNTADSALLPNQAKAMHTMAERIAQSLQMGLAFNYRKSGFIDHPFTAFEIKRSR